MTVELNTKPFVDVFEAALEQWNAEGKKESEIPRTWASDAGRCARQIGFRLAGIERTNPLTTTTLWNMFLGTKIHEWAQEALDAVYPNAQIEDYWQLDNAQMSGSADASYGAVVRDVETETRVVVEMKSKPAWKVNQCVRGTYGNPPAGPEYEDQLQAAISAVALDADVIHLIYFSKQPKGVDPLVGELIIKTPRQEAEQEMNRFRGIREIVVERHKLPKRVFQGKLVEDPMHKDNKWPCHYCGWQRACATLPSGRIDLADTTLEKSEQGRKWDAAAGEKPTEPETPSTYYSARQVALDLFGPFMRKQETS